MFGVKRDKHPAPELCPKDGQVSIDVPILSLCNGLASVSFYWTYPANIYDKMTLLRPAQPPSNELLRPVNTLAIGPDDAEFLLRSSQK